MPAPLPRTQLVSKLADKFEADESHPKPTFVPRRKGLRGHDRTLPPAATFEPERWSKAWKVGEEGDAVYGWDPKPKTDLERVRGWLRGR